MKKNFLFLVLLCGFSFITTSATAGLVTVLGPNQYERSSGAPDVFEDSFRAIDGIGQIQIKNGFDGDKKTVVSSGEIWINGVQLFGPSDFNKSVKFLEAHVNLTDSNTIKVILKKLLLY